MMLLENHLALFKQPHKEAGIDWSAFISASKLKSIETEM